MKKNDIFIFTAPNGVEVTGIAIELIDFIDDNGHIEDYIWLVYAQNRLFSYFEREGRVGKIYVDYAILPDYDDMLEKYQRDIDMEKANIVQPWEEEFERELQGCND